MKLKNLLLTLPLAAALVTLFSRPAPAQYRYENSFYEITRDVETPHIDWADPYYKGAVRVLVVAPRFNQRETVELAQRLQLDFKTVNVTGFLYEGGRLRDMWLAREGRYMNVYGTYKEDIFDTLREKLKNEYDVIIMANVPWDFFPQELESKLWEKIYGGTGLITTYYEQGVTYNLRNVIRTCEYDPEAMSSITGGVPLASLPVFDEYADDEEAARATVKTNHFGEGRVVLLNYPGRRGDIQGFTPNTSKRTDCTLLDYEYYQSLVAKAVLWAGKKEPDVSIAGLSPDGAAAPGSLENIEIGCRLSAADDIQVNIKVVVRDEMNRIEFAENRESVVPTGTSPLSIRVPRLKAGLHFADLWIMKDGMTISWGSTAFTLTGQQMVQSLSLGRQSYAPGEPVEGRVVFAAPLAEDMSLEVRLTDSFERVVNSHVLPLRQGAGNAEFSLPLFGPVSRWIDVAVSLKKGDIVLHELVKGTPVNINPKERDVQFVMWSRGDFQYLSRQINKIFRESGVDTKSNTAPTIEAHEALSRDNLMSIPYMTRIAPDGSGSSKLVRDPCINDPGYRNDLKVRLDTLTRDLRPYAPFMYTLGDENYLGSPNQYFCFSEHCVADFRRYLEEKYKSLTALNGEWNTSFSFWNEVTPDTLKRDAADGNYSRWVDHRMFMDRVFMDAHELGEQAIMNVDPGAVVGADGESGGHAYSGKDYWLYPRVGKYLNIYPEGIEALEQARSFAGPGTRLGSWYGGYVPVPYGAGAGFYGSFSSRTEEYERYYPWWQVLMHFDIPAWFIDYHLAGFEGGMAPDLRLFKCYEWTAEEIRELKAGIGKTILNSERLHDGIAIHFSRASQLAAHAMPEFGAHEYIERSLIRLLEDLGLQYEWVSYEQLENGILGGGKYKVLFLPSSAALSPAEVTAIEEFAQGGGTVIADVRPGIMDAHGKVLPESQLNELFGVQIASPVAKPVEKKNISMISLIGETAGAYNLPPVLIHPDVKAGAAGALAAPDSIPLVSINGYGKGKGIYLNFGYSGYWRERRLEKWAGFQNLMSDLLTTSGIIIPVKITSGGRPERGVEVVRFQDGAIQYVTLLSDEVPVPEHIPQSMVEFPADAHIYDVREGKYLGYGKSAQTVIRPAIAQVYALLPYHMERLAVETKTEYLQGERIEYSIAAKVIGAPAGRHCMRVELTGPDGKKRDYYSRNLFIEGGAGSGEIQLAMNEAPGAWTLQVKDVPTGSRAVAIFRVSAR